MNKQEFNAGKKAYQQPRMKVVEIDSSDIICTSPGEPSRMRLLNEEVREEQKPESVSNDIWGTKW